MPELVYAQGAYDVERIESLLKTELAEVVSAAKERRGDLPAGYSAEELASIDPNSDLSVEPSNSGFGGVGEAILIMALTILVERLVDEILIPRLKAKYGSRAIGDKKSDADHGREV